MRNYRLNQRVPENLGECDYTPCEDCVYYFLLSEWKDVSKSPDTCPVRPIMKLAVREVGT